MSSQHTMRELVELDLGSGVDAKGLPPPYTIFEGSKRTILMLLLSIIGVWSSISNSIYFPALPTLKESLGVTTEDINLSLVAYLIFQGIMPTITSNMADTVGRRPVVLLSFCVYIAANFGISQTRVYWLLVVLRCVQAAGIAPVIAITTGVSGDICTPANRGGFVGFVSGMLMVGQAFGSLLGSAFIARWDWPAIFIFLGIGSTATMLALAFALPETCRSIVGNGSINPAPIYRAPIFLLPSYRKSLTNDMSTLAKKESVDFLAPFRILIKPQIISVLVPGGLQFAAWTMMLASFSSVLEDAPFHYSVAHVGLMYLPQGIACLIGSLVQGRILDWYYKRRHNLYTQKYPTEEEQRANPFNKVRVRLDCLIIPMILTLIGLLLAGWILDRTKNVAAAVVGTCFASVGTASYIAIATTMLVDLNPHQGSASTSCVNFVRCLLAALFTGVMDRMIQTLGLGGCYTFMAAICLASNILLLAVVWNYLKQLRKGSGKDSG